MQKVDELAIKNYGKNRPLGPATRSEALSIMGILTINEGIAKSDPFISKVKSISRDVPDLSVHQVRIGGFYKFQCIQHSLKYLIKVIEVLLFSHNL